MFEKYLKVEEVEKVFSKAFDVFHINLDTDEFAKEIAEIVKGDQKIDGVPWFALCKKDGSMITSNYKDVGNLGYPVGGNEPDMFMEMIKENSNGLVDEDYIVLKKHLIKY